MTLVDFLQLPLGEKLTCSQFFDRNIMKHLLGLDSWYLFKYAELFEFVR